LLHEFAHERLKTAPRWDQFRDHCHILEFSHVPVRCLSIHATYACAHAGECCRAGWEIPIEEHLVSPLRLIGIDVGGNRVAPTRPTGECVFFEANAGRLCTIHRRGGPALLPSACRHFPRVVVKDPRGTSVTLSHFCPTAASLLFSTIPLSIVAAPASLSLGGALEGLDATTVLPPVLSKNILMDWDGYSAWEKAAVRLFNDDQIDPEQAVSVLLAATNRISEWKPGTESLSSSVRCEFMAGVEEMRRPAGRWGVHSRPVKAFLAAHAFASWAAYEPEGIRSVAGAVESALRRLTEAIDERNTLLTKDSLTEALRSTDFEIRHQHRT
jgi:Fe-S-cluster containining protein